MYKALTLLLLALAASVSSVLAQRTPAAAPSTAAQSGDVKDGCATAMAWAYRPRQPSSSTVAPEATYEALKAAIETALKEPVKKQ